MEGRIHALLIVRVKRKSIIGMLRTKKKAPSQNCERGFSIWSLALTYSHMGKPHTTIGDAPFHF